jgi:hypothetical protein
MELIALVALLTVLGAIAIFFGADTRSADPRWTTRDW